MKTAWVTLLSALAVGAGLAGCATFAPAPPPTDPSGAAGREVYLNRCARCHRFHHPADYSPSQWREWMDKMADKARLEQGELESLEAYLDGFRSPPTVAQPARRP